ncbi:MAG TPA: DUF6531 domain-containing protein, partial [Burkholderiales bacterium]|nr:DUF6531 domain-containing protein [Burkholderiales bacterium]
MKMRGLFLAILWCALLPAAQADFPKLTKWTAHGGNVQNTCLRYPGTETCILFDSSDEALAENSKASFCQTPTFYSFGSYPNETWSGDARQFSNCGGLNFGFFQRQWSQAATNFCPANANDNGTTCSCKPGFLEIGRSCHGAKNNGCPPPGCSVGNPVNPGSGNKYETQPLYRSAQGLNFALVYNSHDEERLSFGYRWRGTYDRTIKLVPGAAVSFRHDGKALRFTLVGGAWVSDADTADRLVELKSGGVTTGWTLYVAQTDETETYNAAGKLIAITSRTGLSQTLAYSDGTTGANGGTYLTPSGDPTSEALVAGLLIRVTDSYSRVLGFRYYRNRSVGSILRPGGGSPYRFTYDSINRLTSIIFPDGRVRAFLYDEQAHTAGTKLSYALTGIVDENNERYATFQYDAQGRAVATEHAGGVQRYTVSYNSDGSAEVTDALGATRTYRFQNLLDVFRSNAISGPACPGCGAAAQSFDANGNVASRTDWNGNVTTYVYDLTRNLEIRRVEAAGTTYARTTSTEWHPAFRLPTRIAEPLRLTTMVYDPDGIGCGARGALCSKTLQATGDTDGSLGFGGTVLGTPRTWNYTYDANGSVLTIDGPRTDVADVTTYAYHANDALCNGLAGCRGQVATIRNAAGHVTEIPNYTAHGEPLTIVDPNGLITTFTYDARQRLTSRTVGGEVTTYTYDNAGQLIRVTLPDSSYLEYTYDAAHRLTGMQDNLGHSVVYDLDATGNRTREQVFDPSSQLAQTRGRVFNNLNRLFRELGALGQTTEYAYDNQGNVTSVKNPLNHLTTNQYDALNRLKQVTDPAPVSGVTQYAYNGQDQLVQVTDPRGLVTGYTVDGLGNLAQQSSPDTGNTLNTYDAAGNLLTQTDAKSQTT